ncbi:type IV pilin protein [Parahaliea aestuarii]|uniref:Type IV pilin protein n=2 Tax=Parahaliea aestuarii TaxID=1852021 RepID=A0A5C8ZRL2_9GAMM|nr:type IV pilin protein [Parahaliea aestuarii]
MIAVVIVGILMAVALPAYQNSLIKGRRSDGMSALFDVANRQEQFLLDQNTYTTDMRELGFQVDPMVSEEGHYSVDAAPCTGGTIATCYIVSATPIAGGAQANDSRCGILRLDSSGRKTATGTRQQECW